ncbi:MAG: hypothetical protein R6U98_20865, partial [Pirellulaceae bacterium]
MGAEQFKDLRSAFAPPGLHAVYLKKVIEDDELTNFVLKGKSLKKVLQNEPDDDSKEKFFE